MTCPFRLQLITSEETSDDELVERARIVLASVPKGSVSIHVRRRSHEYQDVKKLAERMAEVCALSGAFLVVNRHVDLAAELGAGLHLGKPDGAMRQTIDQARAANVDWISLSTHADEEVELALSVGVSAAMVSPIFATQSGARTNKVGDAVLKTPRGLSALTRASAIGGGDLAYIALGGVDALLARQCFESEASAVALMHRWNEMQIDNFVDEWAPLLSPGTRL